MREIKVTSYIKYDSDRDRSEELGWSKVCDEAVPSEAEQDLWAAITIITTLIVGIGALLVG